MEEETQERTVVSGAVLRLFLPLFKFSSHLAFTDFCIFSPFALRETGMIGWSGFPL